MSDVGGKLADQVLVQLYTPAYVFWAGGTAIYVYSNWNWLRPVITELSETKIILLVIAWVLLVAASAAIAQRFEPALIRLLEGYHWPSGLKRVAAQRFQKRRTTQETIWQGLATRVFGKTATQTETESFIRADLFCHNVPSESADVMPTRLGNVLRAAERRISAKYGLEPRICWSRLWGVMSKDDREAWSASRATLDIGARSFIWGGLFVVWTFWAWWALPVAVLAMIASYLWMLSAAAQYCELLEAAFDVFRFSLYKSLGLELPASTSDEVILGQRVTAYLWRGTGTFELVKSPPKAADD